MAAFGDAQVVILTMTLNKPIDMASTPSGNGWLVASDGGISFGDAHPWVDRCDDVNKPIVDMASTPSAMVG